MSSYQELASEKYYQPPARGEPRLTTQSGSRVEYSVPAFLTEPVFWAVVGLPLLWISIDLAFGESDRQKFERLEIGMTRAEVQAILHSETGKSRHLVRDIPDNVNLSYNTKMIVTLRGCLLVDKQWVGPDD